MSRPKVGVPLAPGAFSIPKDREGELRRDSKRRALAEGFGGADGNRER